jgi:calcium/calmodulin-dependent protein kinase I
VYRVRNFETGEVMSAKCFAKDPKDVEQLYLHRECIMQEVEVMRQARGFANLLHLYEVHETKTTVCFIVELLPGGELFTCIKEKGSFTFKEAASVMKQCLQGLVEMYKMKVVHRDVKPENILFRYRGRPIVDNEIVICDFGLACPENGDGKDLLLKVCGSPGYIAPEVLIQGDGDKDFALMCSSDMFSMGVIFYTLLSGNCPWNPNSKLSIIEQNKECRLDWENRFIRDVDPHAKILVQRMLMKDPAYRISASDA